MCLPAQGRLPHQCATPHRQIADLALGVTHIVGDSYLRYQIAGAHSRCCGPPVIRVPPSKGTSATNDCAHAPSISTDFRPRFTCAVAGDPAITLANHKLDTIDLTTGQATQLNLHGNITYSRNYHLDTHASTFEFGGQFRNEHKGQNAYSPEYDASLGTTAGFSPRHLLELPLLRRRRSHGPSHPL